MGHLYQHFRASNFDIFSESIRNYDVVMKRLGHDRFVAEMQHIAAGAVTINKFATTSRLEVYGSAPPNVLTFGVPTERCEPFVWRDRATVGNTLQIYHARTEFELVTRPVFQATDVSIARDEMERICALWELPGIDSVIRDREMADCNPQTMQAIRRRMNYVCREIALLPEVLENDTDCRNIVTCEIPALIVNALVSPDVREVRPMVGQREKLIRKAVEYMRDSPGHGVSVESICSEIGIGIRSLQRAFKDKYDLTPKIYLQAQRFNQVYQSLLQARPETASVAEAAATQGFWHMSQFARDYQRFFGELPSATLKRSQ